LRDSSGGPRTLRCTYNTKNPPLKNILLLIAAATLMAGCGHDNHRRDRDRDHNGIPDRYERNRDSDGDGVPDRYDRRPYDPRKN
jgi:hypothetical protein